MKKRHLVGREEESREARDLREAMESLVYHRDRISIIVQASKRASDTVSDMIKPVAEFEESIYDTKYVSAIETDRKLSSEGDHLLSVIREASDKVEEAFRLLKDVSNRLGIGLKDNQKYLEHLQAKYDSLLAEGGKTSSASLGEVEKLDRLLARLSEK